MSTTVNPFKPTGAGTMKVTGSAFVPGRAFIPPNQAAPMSTVAAVFQPQAQPVQQMPPPAPPKPVEPPKEKYVLMLERIVLGCDNDVKADEITEEDQTKITEIKKTVDQVKTDKTISVKLLTTFLS